MSSKVKPNQDTSIQDLGGSSRNSAASTSPSVLTSPSDKAYEETRDAFILGSNIVREVSEATELLSPLKSTCLLLTRGLEMTRAINNNKKAWAALASKLELQLATLEDYQTRLEGHQCNQDLTPIEPLTQYATSLKKVLAGAVKKRNKSMLKRYIRTNLDAEEIADQTQAMDAAYRRFIEAMKILQWIQAADQTAMIKSQSAMLEDQSTILKNHGTMIKDHGVVIQEIREGIKRLNRTSNAPMNDEDEAFLELAYGTRLDLCQEGTRVEILEQIRQWIADATSSEQIFWLNDIAGTGKSTIAATIADDCLISGNLAGRFFFTPNSEATSSLKRFCETVAQDMVAQLPSIQLAVQNALDDSQLKRFPFNQKFKRLLIDPLEEIDGPVVFIFDALDNCDIPGHRTLLQLLLKHLPTVPMVKALVTSRPFASIKDLLEKSTIVTGHDIQLYSVPGDPSSPDITIYVNQQYNFRYLTQGQRKELIMRSQGLFIWVATASRLFQDSREYEDLLALLIGPEYAGDIDMLYLGILKRALVDPKAHNNFMNVLRIVVTALEPISISTIEIYLPQNQMVSVFIHDLASVLKDGDPHRPIHLLHPTFREFLARNERANGFLVEFPTSHALLAQACLTCLLDQLHYDMAGLHKPGTHSPSFNSFRSREAVKESLSRSMFDALHYASNYWAAHVIHSTHNPEVAKTLRRFLSTKTLNWIELMSSRKLIPQGIQSMLNLSTFIQTSAQSQVAVDDADLLQDLLRFFQRHQGTIAHAALHTYRSALMFIPRDTLVYRNYYPEHEKQLAEVLTGIPQVWESYTPLIGDDFGVGCAVWSPKGDLIAVGSLRGSLRVWNAATAACIEGRYHRDGQISGALFTPDGQKVIAYGTSPGIVVCDAQTGSMKEDRLLGHEERITTIAISPDGATFASASTDRTLRFWDLALEECQAVVTPTHSGPIFHLAYSADGTILASASSKQLAIWSSSAHIAINLPWDVAGDDIEYMTFLPDGTTVLSGSRDGCLQLTNSTAHPPSTLILEGHEDPIASCAISADGGRMASGDRGGGLFLWNMKSMPPSPKALIGHSRHILSMRFNADGSQLFTTSRDDTLRIWDTTTGKHTIGLLWATGDVVTHCSVISPNCSQAITGYDDGRLLLWRVDEQFMGTTDRHTAHNKDVEDLAISDDRSLLASGSKDGTVKFWNPKTGQNQGATIIHGSPVRIIVFCPGGEYIASGAEDGSARVWHVSTSLPKTPLLQHHSKKVSSIAFSKDNRYVASGSDDMTICLWD